MNILQAATRTPERCIAACLLIMSITAATPAWAQATGENALPEAAPGTVAANRYREGVRLAVAGQWDLSRELLLASFKLSPSPTTAANLGRVELKTGRYRDAVAHLTFFLRNAQGVS